MYITTAAYQCSHWFHKRFFYYHVQQAFAVTTQPVVYVSCLQSRVDVTVTLADAIPCHLYLPHRKIARWCIYLTANVHTLKEMLTTLRTFITVFGLVIIILLWSAVIFTTQYD